MLLPDLDPNSIKFWPLDVDSTPAIQILEAQAHRLLGYDYLPSSSDTLNEMLRQNLSWGAFVEGALVGIRLVNRAPVLSPWPWSCWSKPESSAEFAGLVIEKRYAGRGIGSALNKLALNHLPSELATVLTTVGISNHASIRVQEKSDFSRLGQIVVHKVSHRWVYRFCR